MVSCLWGREWNNIRKYTQEDSTVFVRIYFTLDVKYSIVLCMCFAVLENKIEKLHSFSRTQNTS